MTCFLETPAISPELIQGFCKNSKSEKRSKWLKNNYSNSFVHDKIELNKF